MQPMAQIKKTNGLSRNILFFLALGIVFEIGAVVQRLYVEDLFLNAVSGMVASLVLFFGAIRFLMAINLGQQAIGWVVLAGFFYFGFRVVDLVETMHRDYFAHLLRVDSYFNGTINFDAVLRDILIVSSAMTLLIGVTQALYISFKDKRLLIERNVALDAEVHKHKAAELRARMSQETLGVLINALSAAVFLVDREGRIVTHNRYFAETFGDGQTDLHGKMLHEIMPAPLYDHAVQRADNEDAHGPPQNYVRHYNGRTYDVKAHPIPAPMGVTPSVAILAQDITDRLADEQARALRDTAISCTAETVMITDNNGTIEYVNPAFEVMTGYHAQEACGRKPSLLRSGHHDADFYRALWNTISGGGVWRGEFVNRRKNGELFREQAAISPITDEQGMITHYVAVKRDVTRERELEQQVQQAQKLDIVGTLAGGIAHDFNNVLAIIIGHSELMLNRTASDHALRKSIETIMRTASRSSKLTQRLLTFTRKGIDEAGPVQAASAIQEQINVARVYIPSNILIEEEIPEDVGYIHAELGEVQMVLLNLCTNASHAMQPAGGRLAVSLETMTLDAALTVATGDLPPGDYVHLRVLDTGCGMDDATRQRIFEPFYTTKERGAGTGLGLSMVHGSVTRFGGGVNVMSEPGQGTRFDVYWPRIDYAAPTTPEAEDTPSGNGRYVLVVDDVEDFNVLTELNLVNYGFRVKAFSQPREALDFFQTNATEIDAVITDFMMPEMNGAELARLIHDIRPELPIILLTGYASGITKQNAPGYGFSLVLRKPATAEALARRLIELAPPRQHNAPQA